MNTGALAVRVRDVLVASSGTIVALPQARRAVVYHYKEFLRFLWIAENHDATYPAAKRR
jgi:hypothetical protein